MSEQPKRFDPRQPRFTHTLADEQRQREAFKLSDGTDISRMTAAQIAERQDYIETKSTRYDRRHFDSPRYPNREEARRRLTRARLLWLQRVLCAVAAGILAYAWLHQ